MDTITLFREMSTAGIKAAKVDELTAWEIAKSFNLLSLEYLDRDAAVRSVFRHGAFIYGVYVELVEEDYLA